MKCIFLNEHNDRNKARQIDKENTEILTRQKEEKQKQRQKYGQKYRDKQQQTKSYIEIQT